MKYYYACFILVIAFPYYDCKDDLVRIKYKPVANNEPNITWYSSLADQKFHALKRYTKQAGKVKNVTGVANKREYLRATHAELILFVLSQIHDLKRLLITMDWAMFAMSWLKINKRMDAQDAKSDRAKALIPYGIFVSPEYRCAGGSYWVISNENIEDVQMILESEKRPNCFLFKRMFDVQGFHHTPGQSFYVGPHREYYATDNPNGGLYCKHSHTKCLWKINPREQFAESVEFEPKVSYRCGAYRYYIPPTTDVRCIFSYYLYNFIFQFGYEGRTFKSDGFSFTHPNGQVFFTDELWSDLACSNYVCKWRHYQSYFKH